MLFLTNTTMGTNIFQFNLLSSFQLIKQWKPPNSCKQHEYIDDIKYNNGTLALIIKVSSSNTVYLELRSSTTLERMWKIKLDINQSWFQQTIRCCSIKYDEWIIVEGNTSHIFHILKNGKLKIMGEYKPSAMNAVLFGSNIFVIRTKENIFFHRL
jgi:predicted secreted protein